MTKAERLAVERLYLALAAFTDYYDQAGIGLCHERNDDKDDDDGFDGDERSNVRWGRRALKHAEKTFVFLAANLPCPSRAARGFTLDAMCEPWRTNDVEMVARSKRGC